MQHRPGGLKPDTDCCDATRGNFQMCVQDLSVPCPQCVGREAARDYDRSLFTQTAQLAQHTVRNLIIVMRVIYCADSSLLLAENQNFIPLPYLCFAEAGLINRHTYFFIDLQV